jgi:RNA polymerase sigma-70 factor (ECF subfamily)
MDDAIIVELYWQRDEAAISETERKYSRYLTKIANNILANIEDCRESVNDTYMKAWNSMPENKPLVLSTYLGKITRQSSIDIFRKHKSKKRYGSEYEMSLSELDECIPSSGDDPEHEIEASMLAEIITSWLRILPQESRDVFVGRYYFMDSIKAVAAYCSISESKAKSILYRARLGLKEHLEKEGYTI